MSPTLWLLSAGILRALRSRWTEYAEPYPGATLWVRAIRVREPGGFVLPWFNASIPPEAHDDPVPACLAALVAGREGTGHADHPDAPDCTIFYTHSDVEPRN